MYNTSEVAAREAVQRLLLHHAVRQRGAAPARAAGAAAHHHQRVVQRNPHVVARLAAPSAAEAPAAIRAIVRLRATATRAALSLSRQPRRGGHRSLCGLLRSLRQMSGVRIAFSVNRFSLPMSALFLTRVDDHSYSLLTATWPLHDIAITNIVWCTAYKRGVGGGSYIAQ